jgi:hypothetical protein
MCTVTVVRHIQKQHSHMPWIRMHVHWNDQFINSLRCLFLISLHEPVKVSKHIKSQDLLKKNIKHATVQTDIKPKNICELQVEIQLSTLLSSRIPSPSPTSPTGSYNHLNLLLQDNVHNTVTVHGDTIQCEQNTAEQNAVTTITSLLDMDEAQQFTTTWKQRQSSNLCHGFHICYFTWLCTVHSSN